MINQNAFNQASLFCWSAMLFVLPFSTALTVGFSIFGTLFALLGFRRESLRQLLREPLFWALAAFLAWMALSIFWTVAPVHEVAHALNKYRKLLFALLIAMVLLNLNRSAENLLKWLVWGCTLVATASLFSYSGLAALVLGPPEPSIGGWAVGGTISKPWSVLGAPDNPTFGRSHIGLGFFQSLAVTALLAKTFSFDRPPRQILINLLWAVYLALPIFMAQGRTGYLLVALGVLAAALYQFRKLGLRRLLMVLLLSAAVLSGLLLVSKTATNRISEARQDVVQYQESGALTSQGIRLRFNQAGIKLWSERPILGWGLGAFSEAYSSLPDEPSVLRESRAHPHSEFILTITQTGLIGFALISILLMTAALAGQGSALLLALGSLVLVDAFVASVLWDFSEGHFIAVLLGILIARSAQCRMSPVHSPPPPRG